MDSFANLEYTGWQRVAAGYDSVWGGLTGQFVEPLLDAIGVGAGDRVLDVACGPGYVAESARGRGATAIGVDFSSRMVELATARVPGIEFREGDAAALPFPSAAFEKVACNFGALHFPDPQAAFAEARRVLSDESRFGFTVWAGPEESPGAEMVEKAITTHIEAVDLPEGPDYYLLSDRDGCRSMLVDAGFEGSSMSFETVTVDWEVPTSSFIFEAQRDSGVRTTALLAQQSPEALEAIRVDIEQGIEPFARGPGYAIPFAAHVIAIPGRRR